MVDRSLVEVRPVPGPGRGKLVVATREGWDALHTGLEVVLGIHRRWSDLIDADEIASTVTGLRTLIELVKAQPLLAVGPKASTG